MGALDPTSRSARVRGTTGQWLTDRAIRAVLTRALARPYDERVAHMGRLVTLLAPLTGWQGRAETQLAMVYPEMAPDARRSLARAVADNAGRTLIETYSGPDLTRHLAGTLPQGPGVAALEEARAAGRPVLLATGHFANHEVPRYVLTAQGYEIGGLYRPMQNPYFNTHYVATLADWSGPVFPQGRRGTAGFARFLKSGGIGVLLFDVWTKGGTRIDFLGHPAATSLALAQLSLRHEAVLIPTYALRAPNGLDFTVTLDAPIPHSDPLTMMQAVTASLETRIRAHPDQWFWIHRRWKPERHPARRP